MRPSAFHDLLAFPILHMIQGLHPRLQGSASRGPDSGNRSNEIGKGTRSVRREGKKRSEDSGLTRPTIV
eukprot:scaffold100959_cov29-Tisochrysis_lutea.AAC.4